MLKAFFARKLSQCGQSTFLSHGKTVEGYEKPTLTELGSILELTDGSEEVSADDGTTGYIYGENSGNIGNG